MKLTQIRIEFNQKLTEVGSTAPERTAMLDIYYCLLRSTEKSKAAVGIRRLMSSATDELLPMYQEILTQLETPHRGN